MRFPPATVSAAALIVAAVLVLSPVRVWPDDAPRLRFQEIAAQAGLNFILENHPTDKKHLIETMAGGVAAFDYDGDGLVDIYFTNGAAVPSLKKDSPKYWTRLYRNRGGMKFEDVTEKAGVAGSGYSMGAAAADYDNDGNVDLFVAGVGRNILYRNEGNGVFREVTEQAGLQSSRWSVHAVWLDYDNDGWLDLFVVHYLQWTPDFDVYCGDQTANVRAYCHPRLFDGLPNALYRNQGDGTFKDVSASSGIGDHVGKGMSAAIADYDLDGFADIFVTNDKHPNFLFRNLGDGTFEELGLLAGVALPNSGNLVSGMGADFRDYDNDGLADITFAALAGETFPLFRNAGDGFFEDATFSSRMGPLSHDRSGWGIALIDFNNDGFKDIFTANSHVNDTVEFFEASRHKLPNSVFVQAAGGAFQDASQESGLSQGPPRPHRGSAFADFDNDGRIDIVVSSLGEPAELWRNVTAGENSWLILKLTGVKSNRDGIGARVQIGNQHNHMTTAVGYASSSHFGVHFGLKDAKQAPRIDVHWPSGVKQTVTDAFVNQTLDLTEPESE